MIPEVEELYRQYGPMVLRRARMLLRDEQAARDAMQEVFVRVLRSRDEFRGDASPVTWLYRITTNHCLNVIRGAVRQRDALRRVERSGTRESAPAPEDRLTVATVLQRIPDDLREVGIYYYVDQMKQEEIASLLGVSRRTVGNRLDAFREAARAVVGRPHAGGEDI
jgi:RNA polymerase sigma-70 factor (ECF subfamily)